MPAAKTELRKECVRLRVEERLSYKEIQVRTGVSKGSLSGWLKGYPLSEEEKTEKRHRGVVEGNRRRRKERGGESEIHRVVRSCSLNGVQVAKVAETAVLLRMLARGFSVFGSMFDGDTADWVVEPAPGKMLKVQVKTAVKFRMGLPVVPLTHGINSKKGRRKYGKNDFDYIVGYDLFTDTAYVWSWSDVAHLRSSVTVSEDAKEAWVSLGNSAVW